MRFHALQGATFVFDAAYQLNAIDVQNLYLVKRILLQEFFNAKQINKNQ
jgi:hypothetical protein